jgi:alpha-mannosidase
MVSGVKQAEDGRGLIVRVYNLADQRRTGAVTVDPLLSGRIVAAQEVDLIERPIAGRKSAVAGNRVRFGVPGHGLLTLKLRLSRPR